MYIIIEREAGEIIRLVASVRLSVCLFICLKHKLAVQGLCVCVCNQLLFREVAPSRSITLLIIGAVGSHRVMSEMMGHLPFDTLLRNTNSVHQDYVFWVEIF